MEVTTPGDFPFGDLLRGFEKQMSGVAFQPLRFLREVRVEVTKVTWPSRRETLVTTGLVFVMAAFAAAFFFIADQIIGIAVRALFGAGI